MWTLVCCTRRFVSCLGPRIYRLLVPRDPGRPLMCGGAYVKAKCSTVGPENDTNCIIFQVFGDFARWDVSVTLDIPWLCCRQPVTSESFNAMAAAAKAAAQAGHWPCGLRHWIFPIQIHSLQRILNCQLNFRNLPLALPAKPHFVRSSRKGRHATPAQTSDHHCPAYSRNREASCHRLHLVWTLWLGSQGRWSQPMSCVSAVSLLIWNELIMIVGYHWFFFITELCR